MLMLATPSRTAVADSVGTVAVAFGHLALQAYVLLCWITRRYVVGAPDWCAMAASVATTISLLERRRWARYCLMCICGYIVITTLTVGSSPGGAGPTDGPAPWSADGIMLIGVVALSVAALLGLQRAPVAREFGSLKRRGPQKLQRVIAAVVFLIAAPGIRVGRLSMLRSASATVRRPVTANEASPNNRDPSYLPSPRRDRSPIRNEAGP